MRTLTYAESLAGYADLLDAVSDRGETVTVTRPGHEPVVFVSLADYASLRETVYLLGSPANARRLPASIERLEHGGGSDRELSDRE